MNSLPSEILLEICEQLGYEDLKCLQTVSRRFYSLLRHAEPHTIIAANLFRGLPTNLGGKEADETLDQQAHFEHQSDNIDIKVHPALLELDCSQAIEAAIEACCADDSWIFEPQSVVTAAASKKALSMITYYGKRMADLITLNENATMPATNELKLCLCSCSRDIVINLKNDSRAITIADVLKEGINYEINYGYDLFTLRPQGKGRGGTRTSIFGWGLVVRDEASTHNGTTRRPLTNTVLVWDNA